MPSDTNPVFVKVDRYKEILDILSVIDKKILGVKHLLSELEELKRREDDEIASWERNIDEITQRMDYLKEELS